MLAAVCNPGFELSSFVDDGLRRNDETKYIMRALIINDFVTAKNDSNLVGCRAVSSDSI